MDSISNRDLGFEQRSSGLPNDQSSGIFYSSQPEKIFRKPVSSIKSSSFSSLNTATSFSISDRDQVNSLTQNVDFKGHMVSHNQRNLSSYNVGVIENEGYMGGRLGSLLCYPLSTGFFEQEPNILCFGSGNFKETTSPFATSVSLSDYQLSDHGRIDRKNGVIALSKESDRLHDPASQEHRSLGNLNMDHTLEEIGGRKRKRTQECHTPRLNPQFDVVQSRKIGQSEDISHVSVEASKEIDDQKQQKNEQNPSLNANKLITIPIKGRLQNADAPEENCIHVRPRRGQATNSHSLAERVRREKISKRMKFLQDLVPGCSKVTGKAVMIDEIINYVQSLQRQVEFLSLKLATVNPELDFDIDQILRKDIIHSCSDGSRALRFAPAVGSHNPFLLEPLLGALEVKMAISGIENSGGFHSSPNSQSQLLSMDQTSILCDDELQRIVQMGFASSTPLNDLTKNGPMKVEHR